MNSISRLLGEADEFAPVLASSSAALMARKRRARQDFRRPENVEDKREERVTQESVATELKSLGERMKGDPSLAQWTRLVEKLSEAVSTNSLVPFDAEITVSTTQQTNVVVQPKPPEKDPILAAILGKEPPVVNRPSLEQVQQKNNQANTSSETQLAKENLPKPPTPQDVQRAMEDAMSGKESKPKVELVESSSMSSAMGLFQMESLPASGPLLGNPSTGPSGQIWGAFKKFVKK